MNQILEVDPIARTARLQPGVRNLKVSEAAAPHGLYYAPDPSSQIACSIGGNVAENSGGVHCLKYGLTVHNVLRGPRLHHRRRAASSSAAGAPDHPGLDLLALVIGSEGLLMVVTEVTVKLDSAAAARPRRDGVIRRCRRVPAMPSPRSSPPASSRPASR